MICADHPDVPPVLDPYAYTFQYSCPICGTRDLIPDVLDVIREAHRAHLITFGEEPRRVRLGQRRTERLLHVIERDYDDWDAETTTVFGMEWRPDYRLDPDEVATEGGSG